MIGAVAVGEAAANDVGVDLKELSGVSGSAKETTEILAAFEWSPVSFAAARWRGGGIGLRRRIERAGEGGGH